MPVEHQQTPNPPALLRTPVDPEIMARSAELLWHASQNDNEAAFLAACLPLILVATAADYTALVTPTGGTWVVRGETGTRGSLPIALFAEALDQEGLAASSDWIAAPLEERSPGGDLLVVRLRSGSPMRRTRDVVELLAPVLKHGLQGVRLRHEHVRRIERLEAVLEITSRWNQTQEMETLLLQMAEAATRLIDADRASIFLWDRHGHTLVGRPALGVASGELRIPDDAGIVGQVIHSGEPRRLSLADDQRQVNRRVDTSLGYQTRTLLCVPLRSRRGELLGAFETINKLSGDFTAEDEAALVELAAHAAIALENAQDRESLLESRRQITEQAAQGVRLVGESPVIEALRSTIGRVAGTDLAVLVLGENGTGKEVVSQSIHYQSRRRDQPFIAVNCAALSETLLESELFGHEKGAFTDARDTRQGKFELASGGTLFLDEIGDLSLGGQSKLLRVLEEKIVVRVGGSTSIHTDARVIAATNQNLVDMVRQKRFREDLYFRLNVVTLVLPPLRERQQDILPLGMHFLTEFARRARRRVPKLTLAARRKLESHPWPGNVRELRNLMERLAFLSTADQIDADELSFILMPSGQARPTVPSDLYLTEATDRFQSDYIEQAITRTRGNMSVAAKQLGLHRSNLYRKMRQLGMTVNE